MKKIETSPECYLATSLSLWAKGWYPCGEYAKQEMLFSRNGKIYDLSAADLTQLDRIEKEGLFLRS